MKRRDILLMAGAALASPSAAIAQAAETGEADDLVAAQSVLNGYSTSSEVIEMSIGADDAPLVIHEYASFTCPHCANFHMDQFTKLKAEFVDTGLVRVVFRDVYLDRPGLWASMMARCSGPENFFTAAGLLFHNQGVWASVDTPDMLGYLAEIGIMSGMTDADLAACYDNQALAKNLVAWSERERTSAGVTSTPTLVIGGKTYPNMPYAQLKEIILGELGR